MSMFNQDYCVLFTHRELEVFARPIAEVNGGHGDFLRELNDRLRGQTLRLSDEELLKAFRYTKGKGGHQQRFQALISAAWRAGWEQP